MDPHDFAVLSEFLRSTSGLTITQDKIYLLDSRLRPIAAQYGLGTVAALARALRNGPPPNLKQDIVEAMTTNETSFFRDGTPFEVFRNHVLDVLAYRRKARGPIRVLCAAASSGQEPYSLAMVVAENAARLNGCAVDILGIDIDAKILRRAEEGMYSQFEVQRGLPVQMLMKYFEQRPNQGWQIKPVLRSMVRYKRCNLIEPLRDLGQFDVIFCRNVLIYFDRPRKRDVLERLSEQLAPDGYLFLGGAETVLDITDRFIPAQDHRGLYVRGAPARPLRAAG